MLEKRTSLKIDEISTSLVSIAMCTYNGEKYLIQQLDSLINQTYSNLEIIIVDDGSKDSTLDILYAYQQRDNRVKFVRNSENIGMYRNYNQALLLAKGDYIKFLNADDKFEPTLLEKFVDIMEMDSSISVVTSYRQYFGSKDDILIPPYKGKVEAVEVILSSLQKGNWIGEPTTVMFRKANLNLGLFDISLLMFADQDMWLRHLRVGNLYIIDEVLSYFRIHEEQGTVDLNNNYMKIMFNKLQNAEYARTAIVNNRFGYNLFNEFPVESKVILNNSNQNILSAIRRLRSDSSWASLYSMRNFCQIFLMLIVPKVAFSIKDELRIFRKNLKKLVKD